MKLILMLIAIAVIVLVFLYLCKKMGIDVNGILKSRGGQPTIVQTQPTATNCRPEYEHFAVFVWNCVAAIHRTCDLDCPNAVSDIYCARTADRTTFQNGRWYFLYEIPLINTAAIHNGRFSAQKADISRIREILSENLPDYIEDGFYYVGKVCVYPIDRNRVRIEVPGVDRKYINEMGDIDI